MKASELRIGNWVNFKGKPHKWQRDDFDDVYFELHSPILLTPEWLEKFGFNQSGNKDIFILKGFEVDNEPFGLVKYSEGWLWDFVTIKYVHQLQNLYFTLTGNELQED